MTKKAGSFLKLVGSMLDNNIPREVVALPGNNVLIFTDACYERESTSWPCGLGGVLFCDGGIEAFSLPVDSALRQLLGELVKKQIIFEVETLAAVLAANLWQQRLVNRRSILFVDNEGTKFSLLKGVSDNACVDAMAEAFSTLESDLHSSTWIARVPSKSNIADPPSRGYLDVPLLSAARDVSAEAQSNLVLLVAQIFKLGETAA